MLIPAFLKLKVSDCAPMSGWPFWRSVPANESVSFVWPPGVARATSAPATTIAIETSSAEAKIGLLRMVLIVVLPEVIFAPGSREPQATRRRVAQFACRGGLRSYHSRRMQERVVVTGLGVVSAA